MRCSAVVFGLVLGLSPASAQDGGKATEAVSNMQMEFTVCVAYFNFLKTCAPKDMEEEVTAKVNPTIKFLTSMAFTAAQQIGMSNEVAMARLKMAYEDQQQTISKSCTNFALLYQEHAQRCKQVGENGDKVLQEYLDKAR